MFSLVDMLIAGGIGLFIGAFLGVIVMALCAAAHNTSVSQDHE